MSQGKDPGFSPWLDLQSQQERSRCVISPPSVSKAEWQRALSVIVSVKDSTGVHSRGKPWDWQLNRRPEGTSAPSTFSPHSLSRQPPLWPESGAKGRSWEARRFKGRLTGQSWASLSKTKGCDLVRNDSSTELSALYYFKCNIYDVSHLQIIRQFMNHTITTAQILQLSDVVLTSGFSFLEHVNTVLQEFHPVTYHMLEA